MKKNALLKILPPIVSFAALILLWGAASAAVNNEYILPDIATTLRQFVRLFGAAEFYSAFFGTLARSLTAFVLSFAIAFISALLSKRSEFAERAIKPMISVARALPTVAVVLLLLVWTNSRIAPIIVTMLVVLPTAYTDIKNALEFVPQEQIQTCVFFGVSKKDILFKVKIPQIAPSLLRCCGAGLSLNLKLMVAAEVLSQTAVSMGYLLNTAKIYFEIAEMIALVLVTVIVGVLIEAAFGFAAKRAERWKRAD